MFGRPTLHLCMHSHKRVMSVQLVVPVCNLFCDLAIVGANINETPIPFTDLGNALCHVTEC